MATIDRQWTVDDIHALPDDGNRYEVIDGELFVTPAPAWRHQSAAGGLYALLLAYLARERVGYVFVAPADVIFSPRRAVQPDVFVVPPVNGRRPERFEDAGGLLVAVEVISPGTGRADRVKKRNLYRDEGVPEYWIVDLDARVVERSTPDNVRPEILSDRLVWRPERAAMPFDLNIVDYFVAVLDG
ncbi:MAG: Uma2 family endonuclease [Gemmatimonadota bacterium]|nr:Uma2 family endonuclease [Gemmatimonadota bacterium]